MAANDKTYNEQINKEIIVKMRGILHELPKFCGIFFNGIDATTLPRTKLGYAYDLRIFFNYIIENNPKYKSYEMCNLPLELLEELNTLDLEEYMNYLKLYEKDNIEYTNNEQGLKRKFSALRAMYNYFFSREMIKDNPAVKVKMPRIHEKDIVRLEPNEIAQLLDEVESGNSLSKKQKQYHNKTKVRDLAILTLLLGTGLRVSECVGIDINDINFDICGVKVRRKGGKESVVYFGEEVMEALLSYSEERMHMIPMEGHDNAFFLSSQLKRIGVRTVENLVTKYASLVTNIKHITPHKLRSTYGTALYKETGDIYLVADVLGHSDVNTTRRHYAAQEDERRRRARNAVTLREK